LLLSDTSVDSSLSFPILLVVRVLTPYLLSSDRADVARIPVPFQVSHGLVNETDDPLFHGITVISYSD
jgi:hypothetical protein